MTKQQIEGFGIIKGIINELDADDIVDMSASINPATVHGVDIDGMPYEHNFRYDPKFPDTTVICVILEIPNKK